ncbi:MAG: hypothetical protein ACAI43_07890 [Phycisphaerae bacterium]|nr:hypothetical protein [Tepidisphaeraceae bacterium]
MSDTSPLRALAHLGLVELLGSLFAEVYVPPAVAAEVAVARAKLPALDLSRWPFVRVVPVVDVSRAAAFTAGLHPGETESIALALQAGASHVLMDDRDGRAAAVAAGLVPVGVLGLLIEFTRVGLVRAVAPLLDRLVIEIDFFVKTSVREQVLKLAGEWPTAP